MDFSKSLSFGENTFQEIDKCEAKVKVFDENQLLLKSNAADSDHENIAKSNQKFEQKSTVFVEKAGMQHRITENPLALEKSIISRPTDVPTLGKQHLGADNACYGKERPSKQSPAVSILHETVGISKRFISPINIQKFHVDFFMNLFVYVLVTDGSQFSHWTKPFKTIIRQRRLYKKISTPNQS